MTETNWIPGLLVLGAGVLVGLVLWARARRSASRPQGLVDAAGTDLERQRDALYTQIRALDVARGSMNVDDWRAERHRLVIEAADTLRRMEVPEVSAAAPPPPAAPTWAQRHPTLVGVAWGASLAGFGAALWYGLQTDLKPRAENSMGGGAPAGMADARAQAQARAAAAVDAARIAHEAAPGDVELANRYAHVLLQAGDVMKAFEVSKAVTEAHPDDPEARTHQAVVLMEIGDMTMAGQLLDKVLAGSPAFAEALGYRGAIHYNVQEYEQAATAWEAARTADPSMASMLEPLIARARAGGVPASTPPVAAATGGAPSAVSPADVQGTVSLGAGTVPNGGTVFVYVRPTGVEAGPPAAVVRLSASRFPIDFRVGPGDSPMGGPFPDEMTLTATVFQSGNPSTRSPEDLVGRAEGVKPGQTGVTLTLARREE